MNFIVFTSSACLTGHNWALFTLLGWAEDDICKCVLSCHATIVAKCEVSIARILATRKVKKFTIYSKHSIPSCLAQSYKQTLNRPWNYNKNILGHNLVVWYHTGQAGLAHLYGLKMYPPMPRYCLIYCFYIFLRLHSHKPGWSNWLAQLLLQQVNILHWESHIRWPTSSLD